MTQRILLIAVVTCYCGGVTGPAVAELVTLSSGNSVARIDTGSALGLYSWTVDGVEHLSAQQLWFRVGDNEENPISSAEPVGFTTNGQSATVQFAQGLFDVDLNYALVGGALGSGQSQLAHIITLTNVADVPLDLHLFQYVDLDVDGEFDFNSVSFLSNDLARQIGPSGSIATVAVSDLLSSHRQVAFYPELLDALSDLSPTTLSDFTGPLAGDLTFAFQWDLTLGVGEVASLTLNENLIPEPASLVCLALCAAILLQRRIRGCVP